MLLFLIAKIKLAHPVPGEIEANNPTWQWEDASYGHCCTLAAVRSSKFYLFLHRGLTKQIFPQNSFTARRALNQHLIPILPPQTPCALSTSRLSPGYSRQLFPIHGRIPTCPGTATSRTPQPHGRAGTPHSSPFLGAGAAAVPSGALGFSKVFLASATLSTFSSS